MLNASAATRRTSAGYTLVELVVAVMLLGVVAVTVSTVAARQQRIFRGTLRLFDARGQLRQGAGAIEGLLRGIAPGAGDILATSDTAIELIATTGGSVVCAASGTGVLDVAGPTDSGGAPGLAAWLEAPQPGDTLWLYDEGATGPAPTADSVRGFRIAASDPLAAPCAGGPLAGAAGAGAGLRLTIEPAPARPVRPGAVLRFGRRLRLALYRSPTDGLWYLGLREWAAGAAQPVQPVSGPYRAYARGRGALPGVAFRYADSLGSEPARPGDVARIDVVLRPPDDDGAGDGASGALVGARALDSLLVRVAIRNRRQDPGR